MRYSGNSTEDLVARLFDRLSDALTIRMINDLEPGGDLLQRWGALQEVEKLQTTGCTSCDDDHPVDLEFDPKSRRYRYYCRTAGFVRVDEQDIRAFRLDLDWLRDRLAEGLQIGRPRGRELVPQVLWDLGEASLGGRPWTAFLARQVEAHLEPILHALSSRGSKLPGLVLTSSSSAPFGLSLPYGHRFCFLSDALKVEAGRLTVACKTILSALKGRRMSKNTKSKGRPTEAAISVAIFKDRAEAKQTASTLTAEAIAIREIALREHPDRDVPEWGTIANHIRKGYWLLRGCTPRSTK